MPPRIVSDAGVRVDPGSQVSCSANGTPPIYIALKRNVTVLITTRKTTSSKLYQEGNYTCVATSKYGTDVKHFVIQGKKIRYYFEYVLTKMRPNAVNSSDVSLEAICNDMLWNGKVTCLFLSHGEKEQQEIQMEDEIR